MGNHAGIINRFASSSTNTVVRPRLRTEWIILSTEERVLLILKLRLSYLLHEIARLSSWELQLLPIFPIFYLVKTSFTCGNTRLEKWVRQHLKREIFLLPIKVQSAVGITSPPSPLWFFLDKRITPSRRRDHETNLIMWKGKVQRGIV